MKKKVLNEIDRYRELMGLNIINEAYEDLPKIFDTYPNLTFHDRTKNDRLPKNLLDDIQDAAQKANITISVNYARTGHGKHTKSGNLSRHWSGVAVDLSTVNGKEWVSVSDAKDKEIYDGIEKFVSVLKDKGYKINSESGNNKAVLYFGFSGHDNHLHVSNKSNAPSVDSTEDEPSNNYSSDDNEGSDDNSNSDDTSPWDVEGSIKSRMEKSGSKINDYIKKLTDFS
jgi:hypothetical protein